MNLVTSIVVVTVITSFVAIGMYAMALALTSDTSVVLRGFTFVFGAWFLSIGLSMAAGSLRGPR